ncbi:hypothetical protein [Meiothermus sp.]|uniref:hypothetical protein n=1 Tax=Meiothermus sp. TaxID=1955249 RepID=UPI0021DD62D6|nr:hypothetical protein [Meiothermus sp.]GIW24174.1 MAG: hypothetical protein KatS3mg069_0441 [Meiothermus sp.]
MVAVSKALPVHWFSKLHRVRPRFVYLWVRVQDVPLPIFLFAPLVVLEFFLLVGIWITRRQGFEPQLAFALQALRGQTWELRQMPPFALVEVKIKPKAFYPKAPTQVYVKIGLW